MHTWNHDTLRAVDEAALEADAMLAVESAGLSALESMDMDTDMDTTRGLRVEVEAPALVGEVPIMLQVDARSQRRQGKKYMEWMLTFLISLLAIWCDILVA
jgi:hypothetical protein